MALPAEGLLGVAGAVGVLFGIYLIAFPGRGAVALVIAIGLFAVARGVTLIVPRSFPPGADGRRGSRPAGRGVMSAALLRPRRATRRFAVPAVTAALAAWLFLAGCGTPGSGTAGRETRQVSGIRAVQLTGDAVLSIEQTGVESLTVETDDNLLDHVSSDVVDGTLVLEVDGIIDPTDSIAYEMTVADLESITLTGSGIVEVKDLEADRLDVSISGSGTVTVAGTTAAQAADIGGSGRYNARELSSTTATVDISGSGTATVSVRDRLNVDIAGSGAVTYHGDPVVVQHVSGAGHVAHG